MSNSNTKRRRLKKEMRKSFPGMFRSIKIAEGETLSGRFVPTEQFRPLEHQLRQRVTIQPPKLGQLLSISKMNPAPTLKINLETMEVSIHAETLHPERDKWGSPVWSDKIILKNGRHPLAGQFKQLCYRTCCQRPEAVYYNRSTREHYCKSCAYDINAVNPEKWEDGKKLLVLRENEDEDLDSLLLPGQL